MGLWKERQGQTFPAAQWLGVRLPAQGTWILSLDREESTCHLETGSTCSTTAESWRPGPCSTAREVTAARSSCTTRQGVAVKTQHSQK